MPAWGGGRPTFLRGQGGWPVATFIIREVQSCEIETAYTQVVKGTSTYPNISRKGLLFNTSEYTKKRENHTILEDFTH